MSKILIFIPCYNVERKIKKVFHKLPSKVLKNDKIKLLFIDDNSKDNTLKIIKKIKKNYKKKIQILSNSKNYGYGYVQKTAFQYSIKNNFDIVLMLHGDNQYPADKVIKILDQFRIKKNNAVFGTRMHSIASAFKGGMPMYKIIGNKLLTFLQNFILGSKMSEFHSGFRAYRVNSLKKIKFQNNSNKFHFDTEIIIQFIKKGYQIKEVPMPTYYGDEVSHLKSIPYGLNIIKSTLKYKFSKKSYD